MSIDLYLDNLYKSAIIEMDKEILKVTSLARKNKKQRHLQFEFSTSNISSSEAFNVKAASIDGYLDRLLMDVKGSYTSMKTSINTVEEGTKLMKKEEEDEEIEVHLPHGESLEFIDNVLTHRPSQDLFSQTLNFKASIGDYMDRMLDDENYNTSTSDIAYSIVAAEVLPPLLLLVPLLPVQEPLTKKESLNRITEEKNEEQISKTASYRNEINSFSAQRSIRKWWCC